MKNFKLIGIQIVIGIVIFGAMNGNASWKPATDKFQYFGNDSVPLIADGQDGWVAIWGGTGTRRLVRIIEEDSELIVMGTNISRHSSGVSISEDGETIVLWGRQSPGPYNVEFYNHQLELKKSFVINGEHLIEPYVFNLRLFLTSSNEILGAWGTGTEIYLRKFNSDGIPISDPVKVNKDINTVNLIHDFWVTEQGTLLVYYEKDYSYGLSEGWAGDHEFYLRAYDSGLNPLGDALNLSDITGGEPFDIGLENDGELLMKWDNYYYECTYGILDGICRPIRWEGWLQRIDAYGNVSGDPILYGKSDFRKENYFVPTFTPRSTGGFALVEWSSAGPTEFNLYTFNEIGNLMEGPFLLQSFGESVQYFRELEFDRSGKKLLAFWEQRDGHWARIMEKINTSKGHNVEHQTDDVSITFDEVTDSGYTEVEVKEDGPAPPGSFRTLAPPVYYEITTDAAYSGPVEICINYDEAKLSRPEKLIRLFHWDGHWEDITTSRDTEANEVCGVTESLSTFTLASQARDTDFGVSGGCSAAEGGGEGLSGAFGSAVALVLPIVLICFIGRRRKAVG